MIKYFIILMLSLPLFGQGTYFTEITDLDAERDAYVASSVNVEWVVGRIGGTSVTNFYYEMQYAKNNDWDGPSLKTTAPGDIPMSLDGYNMNLSHTITELTSGWWSFRIRIVQKSGNIPVTDWSNVDWSEIPDDLGAPSISFHLLPGQTHINTPEIYMTFNGSDTAAYELYWGRDTNLPDNAELSRPVNRVNAVVDLQELQNLDKGDIIYFKVSAEENQQIMWSGVYSLIYDPDVVFQKFVQFVANKSHFETINGQQVEIIDVETFIFLDIPSSNAGVVTITFQAMVSENIFGSPKMEFITQTFFPGTQLYIPTSELFPGIHRAPIKMIADYVLNVHVTYKTYFGAKNVAKVKAVDGTTRELVFSAIEASPTTDPGAAVSNMSERDSSVTVWVEYLDPNVFLSPTKISPAAPLTIEAYSSAVFMIHELIPNLPTYWAGKIVVSGNIPMVGVASMTNIGSTNTLDYSESD